MSPPPPGFAISRVQRQAGRFATGVQPQRGLLRCIRQLCREGGRGTCMCKIRVRLMWFEGKDQEAVEEEEGRWCGPCASLLLPQCVHTYTYTATTPSSVCPTLMLVPLFSYFIDRKTSRKDPAALEPFPSHARAPHRLAWRIPSSPEVAVPSLSRRVESYPALLHPPTCTKTIPDTPDFISFGPSSHTPCSMLPPTRPPCCLSDSSLRAARRLTRPDPEYAGYTSTPHAGSARLASFRPRRPPPPVIGCRGVPEAKRRGDSWPCPFPRHARLGKRVRPA